jgi:hypothetical protein
MQNKLHYSKLVIMSVVEISSSLLFSDELTKSLTAARIDSIVSSGKFLALILDTLYLFCFYFFGLYSKPVLSSFNYKF